MIELKHNTLVFSFPEIHPKAKISIEFQRTLRIPDDKNTYPLPPGLGTFPLKHVDDYSVPPKWFEHGGVMLPMFQSEAMWINFRTEYIADRNTDYPFAIKVATGKIDALTGNSWKNSLSKNPQDYMISTEQPWLDGYCVEKDLIRQFVAMPLDQGYTAEEQITDAADYGGLQIIVYPMKRDVFDKRFPIIERNQQVKSGPIMYSTSFVAESCASFDMGLAPGGKIHQEIYEDPFDFNDWDQGTKNRCFVHIANSLLWEAVTGKRPPTKPFSAKEYTDSGLPWFEYYDDNAVSIDGSSILSKLKSVLQKGNDKGEDPLSDNEPVKIDGITKIISKDRVREGRF